MSDSLNITPASFNQAYRGYAVEHGNDNTRASAKLSEAADATQSMRELSAANAIDDVYISPEAARLYAAQVRRLKTVVRRSDADKATDGARSATADHEPTAKANHEANRSDFATSRSFRKSDDRTL